MVDLKLIFNCKIFHLLVFLPFSKMLSYADFVGMVYMIYITSRRDSPIAKERF